MTIEIFDIESNLGLEDNRLKSYASIRTLNKIDDPSETQLETYKSLAGANPNQIDLYYLEAVLVSTGWNKNDDIFIPEEMWLARNTPKDKPFNFMHDEGDIIGHITGCYVEDFEGNRIDDDTPIEDIPKDFNIITTAVVYVGYSDPARQQRVTAIIDDIESGSGKWKVSMECIFSAFDYGIINMATGEKAIIPRNKSSASLSKHLRVYGGSGTFQNHKIGRALRKLTYSGKGLVDEPANERSDIRNISPVSDNFFVQNVTVANTETLGYSDLTWTTSGTSTCPKTYAEVFIDTQENNMSDELKREIDDLKSQLAQAKKDKDDMKKEMEKKKEEESKAQISDFETTIASKDADIDGLKTALADKDKELEDAKAKCDEYKKEKEEADKKVKAFEEEVKASARKSMLAKAGVNEEKIEAEYDKFKDVSDETFAGIVELISKNVAAEDTSDDEVDSSSASEEVLNEVEEEATASVNSDPEKEDDSNELRKSLASLFAKNCK